jgi:chromosome partitioning protein
VKSHLSTVIAVLNQKGGVGKTTTAINLGAYLAKSGKTVLIVDFDPQGNATSGLGFDKQTAPVTSYDILSDKGLTEKAIYETSVGGLYLIPTNATLANAEVDLVGKDQREFKLKNALSSLSYDYILIDCPPALGLLTVNALVASDQLLIPVQSEYYALEGLSQLLSVMQQVKQSLNTKLELLGVIVTMFDSRTSLSEQVHSELQKHFGKKLFKTVIPRNVKLAEEPSHGLPVAEHDKWSKGARAYKALAKEVIQHVG